MRATAETAIRRTPSPADLLLGRSPTTPTICSTRASGCCTRQPKARGRSLGTRAVRALRAPVDRPRPAPRPRSGQSPRRRPPPSPTRRRHRRNPPREGAPGQNQKTTAGPSPHPSAPASRPRSAGCRFIPPRMAVSSRRARRFCSSTILPTRRARTMRTTRTTRTARTARTRTRRTLRRRPSTLTPMPEDTTSHHYMGAFLADIFTFWPSHGERWLQSLAGRNGFNDWMNGMDERTPLA